jgi:hypothetical protein
VRILFIIVGLLIATGCSTMTVTNVSQKKPDLILEQYFLDKTFASGIFEDRFGNVRRQFTVDIDGTWDGKTLTLTEDFIFGDGETETRVWSIEKIAPASYVGTADDVIGSAKGIVSGNTLNWKYDMRLKVGGSRVKVHFDDWMFLQPNGVLINKATVSKLGLDIGRVTIAFTKKADADFLSTIPSTNKEPLVATSAR